MSCMSPPPLWAFLPLLVLLLALSSIPHTSSTTLRSSRDWQSLPLTTLLSISPPRGASTACPVIRCPGKSTCTTYKGAPVCVCPSGQRLIKGVCSSAALEHSDWLDWHNNARAAVGSVPLKWDSSLAKDAQKVADKIGGTSGCSLKHDVPKGQGQNLAGGPQNIGPSNNTNGVLKWVLEGKWYTYHVFDAKKGGCSTGKWRDCGHYTQVIWNKTTSVGCGVARCKSGADFSRIWACNYSPPGNFLKQYPYNQDPCFVTTCPATATCDSSSGSAVCKCPKGQAVVKGKCAKDPCKTKKCKGDQVCNPSTGVPKCECPGSTVPAARNSVTCVEPQCLGVSCPGSSTCQVGAKSAPYCVCSAGKVLQGDGCTASPRTPLILTSVALSSKSSSAARVVRFSKLKECVGFDFKLSKYKILWKAPGTTGSVLPNGVEGKSCTSLEFWNKKGCKGRSWSWSKKVGDTVKVAKGVFAKTVSIKCV